MEKGLSKGTVCSVYLSCNHSSIGVVHLYPGCQYGTVYDLEQPGCYFPDEPGSGSNNRGAFKEQEEE